MAVELYKDGNAFAIKCDSKTEDEFMNEITTLFTELIEAGEYEGDWGFQLYSWLPMMVDVCCKYRGYKTKVEERRVFVAGDRLFGPEATHSYSLRPGHPINADTIRLDGNTVITKDDWVAGGGPIDENSEIDA